MRGTVVLVGWRVGVLAIGAWALVGCTTSTFICSDDGDCGAMGLCEANGFCSFEDGECESGRRFGELSAPGVAGRCVPTDEGSTTAAASTSTSTTNAAATSSPITTEPDSVSTSSTDEGTTVGVVETAETSDGTSGTSSDSSSSTGMGDPAVRVDEGIVMLYRFDEGEGTNIFDHGPSPHIDLTLQGDGFAWTPSGLSFTGSSTTLARSTTSLTKLNDACMDSNEITLEAWLTPNAPETAGPPRIMSYSAGVSDRNFAMLVGRDADGMDEGWKVRLTTTETTANGQPDLDELGPVPADALTHTMFARDADGGERLYLDGDVVASAARLGDFSNWITVGEEWFFTLGNETTADRPFTGELHLVAIYCRALSGSEVQQNFAAGFETR